MTPRFLLAGLLAAAIPGLALWFAAPAERASVGLAVAPFGWPSLVVVHVLAALPLAAALAARSRGWFASPADPMPALGPAGVGLVLAALVSSEASGLGDALQGTDFALRAILRSLLCATLAWPWFLLAPVSGAGRRTLLLLGAVPAFVLPAIHADFLADKGIRDGEDLRRRDRFVRARPQWEGVCDLAPDRVVPGLKQRPVPPEVLKFIDRDVAKITKGVAGGLPAGASPNYRLLFAEALLKLDRTAEAEPILRSLPPVPEVALALGEALEDQGRFAESDDALRSILDPARPATCREAYDRLARHATDRRDRAEVERLLTEATEKLPQFAGHFQLRLGRHFQQTGRPFEALAAFDRAIALDPTLATEVEPSRRTLREHTPGCLIGP